MTATAVRFAPSPTGLLHVGNARTALITWLWARHSGGTALLRLDDTDAERSTEAFAEAIERDLAWLGLDWDRRARQSDRADRYVAAIAGLKEAGDLYPCYETPEELALKRKQQLQRRLPPLYDRAALHLTADDRRRLEAEGRRPHWRFRLVHEAIEWADLGRGPVHFHGADLSDPVLIREDGRPLYHLCSVLDDIDFGITHVVRGEDHVANTAAHVQMFRALGAEPPAFAHLPLIVDAEGKGLSKRLGSLSLAHLRDDAGLEPMAVASLLARLGTADPIEPFASLAPLVDSFSFDRFARAAPKFDLEELQRLNARILHETAFDDVAGRLAARGLGGADEVFWQAVRPNLTRLSDVDTWWQVVAGAVPAFTDDLELARIAAETMPAEPWDHETWGRWTGALKATSGRKGRALFRPLRLALTGREGGPELRLLLPLIGRARAAARLTAAAGAATVK